jgi:hypothetical protein
MLKLLENRAKRGANRLATCVDKVHNPNLVTVGKQLSQGALVAVGVVDRQLRHEGWGVGNLGAPKSLGGEGVTLRGGLQ